MPLDNPPSLQFSSLAKALKSFGGGAKHITDQSSSGGANLAANLNAISPKSKRSAAIVQTIHSISSASSPAGTSPVLPHSLPPLLGRESPQLGGNLQDHSQLFPSSLDRKKLLPKMPLTHGLSNGDMRHMFGSRPFSGSSGVHHFSPATLPVVTFKSVFARIAEVRWDFRTSDPMAPQPGEWTYQLSRAANDDPVFDIVFEGSHNEIKVDGLTPSTRYRFKLRIRPAAANGVDWSRQYAQAECQTTDESQLQKAVSQLLRATQEGNAILVAQLLSQYGRELNMETRDRFGKSLLMIACQNGNAEVVKLLIDNGASMAATTQSGKTALSIAVTYGNLKAVESLIALKVDVDQADQGGSTPLMWAVENANGKNGISIIEALLNGGANLNREDGAGQAPFDRLCSTSGNVRAARLMIEFALASTATSPFIMHTGPFSYGGAKVPLVVQRPDKKHPMTSLMSAALNGNKDLCRELIERYGADVTAKTEFGFSALDFAENGGHHAIADMIRAKMKSLEAEFDGEGRSAAAVAAAAAAVAAIATITSAPTGGSVGTLQEPSSKSDSVSRMNTRMTLSKTTRHSSVISIFSIDGDLQPHEVALIKGKQPKALSSVRGRGKQLPAPKSSRSPSRRPSAR